MFVDRLGLVASRVDTWGVRREQNMLCGGRGYFTLLALDTG